MTQVLMLQSAGNNESAWARLMSARGRVILFIMHDTIRWEVWEYGKLVDCSPPKKAMLTTARNILLLHLYTYVYLAAVVIRVWRRYGRMDITIGTSSHLGMTGLLARRLGMARKMVSLLQDYFPVKGPPMARLWRRYHAAFSRFSAKRADEVWMVSSRIPTANVNPNRHVIPIYIDDSGTPPSGRTDIAYVGHPLEDHCILWLFDICRKHGLRLHFVGQSPYMNSIKHLAPPDTVFYGFIGEAGRLREILARCFCGYAVYGLTGADNFAWYGVPSKVYLYLANNVPVVSTDITEFSANIASHSLGKLVNPHPGEVESAILDLRDNYRRYYDSINSFRSRWNDRVETFLNERLDSVVGPHNLPDGKRPPC